MMTSDEENSYESVAASILKASQTLIMLSLNDVANAMRQQSIVVSKWTEIPSENALNTLFDVLLQADNSVATLDREMTPGAQTVINNTRISLHQLDEARSFLVQETRNGLSLIKRSVLSYIESNGEDPMHLSNIPTTLQSSSGGLEFLGVPRGAVILRTTVAFVEAWVANKKMPNMTIIENFADVIACVDYFLESLEVNKPISENVFDIAEDALAELGYPVPKQQAA
jgi:chemosensory pili system protein ChpA (sensor histidine kinase/response regulator)